MSEFEDRDGNLLRGSARRRSVRMDGMSRRELRKRDAIESKEPEEEEREPEIPPFSTYAEVVEFARHLVEEEDWSVAELLGFLAKPWKWDGEFREWRSKNRI